MGLEKHTEIGFRRRYRKLIGFQFALSLLVASLLIVSRELYPSSQILVDILAGLALAATVTIGYLASYTIIHRKKLWKAASRKITGIQLRVSIFLFIILVGAAECIAIIFNHSATGLLLALTTGPTAALVVILYLLSKKQKIRS